MRQLEPTYLRYIYGGLVNGIIHQENTAELPDGLIGLYEEAFSERKSVGERQKLLQRFAIWAYKMLKGIAKGSTGLMNQLSVSIKFRIPIL